jgi:hypothetical protein
MANGVYRVLSPVAWRRLATAFLVSVGVAFIGAVVVIAYVLIRMEPIDLKALPPGLPESIKLLLPIYQKYSTAWAIVVSLVGVSLALFMFILATQVLRADRIKFFGAELSVTEEVRDLQHQLGEQTEQAAALAENLREIESLLERLNRLVISGSFEEYCECLDETAEVAAFIIRPIGRAVRVSIWLYCPPENLLRIVGSYRVSYPTLRNLTMPREGPGYAAFALRAAAPVTTNNLAGPNWIHDRWSTRSTTSILAQPIEVGENGGWQAVLCFSTDRDIEKFPDYAFNVPRDGGVLRLFAVLVSTVLSLAEQVRDQEGQLVLTRIFGRYTV